MEIKLTSQPDPRDLERLDRVADLVRARKRIVVSTTRTAALSDRHVSCDLGTFLEHLRARPTE
jgi:hypothetical protein